MRYYSNIIGSLFGLFGGRKVVAVPELDDIAGLPEIRISILESFIRTDEIMQTILTNPEDKERAFSLRIKSEKLICYHKRMLRSNGYYTGVPDFAEMDNIKQEMAEDLWLKKESEE